MPGGGTVLSAPGGFIRLLMISCFIAGAGYSRSKTKTEGFQVQKNLSRKGTGEVLASAVLL